MLNQLTNVKSETSGEMVVSFEFMDKNGKPMTVHGDTALATASFTGAEMLGKKAGILKAIALYKFSLLNTDMLKEKYSCKDGRAFLEKFVTSDISKNTYNSDVLTVSRFIEVGENNDYTYKYDCIKDMPIGKLRLLNKYFAKTKEQNPDFDDDTIEMSAIATMQRDFETGVITPYMTDSKFSNAIDKSFRIIEEPKAEEPKAEEPKAEEPKAEEPKAEEPKTEEPKASFKDFAENQSSRGYANLVKVQLALEAIAKFKESKSFTKLSDEVKGIIETANDALMFTEETFIK